MADAQARLGKKRAKFMVNLREVHDALTDMQDDHNETEYKCVRAGNCCKVGLQLHLAECEYIAENLRQMAGNDPALLEPFIERLEHAFEDEAWTWGESVGDQMCAFFEDGCTVYPFRPGVCRMYGVMLDIDEWCPRKRLASGEPFTYGQVESDALIARFYKILDDYGEDFPHLDYTVYMPHGVLFFLVPAARLEALKARTAKRFWKRQTGYRTQYEASYDRDKPLRTNVKFDFAIPGYTPGKKKVKVPP